MSENTYIIRGGDYGAERLRVISDTLKPYTKNFLLFSGVKDGMKVLDLGCGNGDVTALLSELVGENGFVYGVDMDDSVIKFAENSHSDKKNIQFICNNINNIDFSENSFDLIYMRFILSHLPKPADMLEKAKSLLNPNGIIVCEDVDFSGHFCYPDSPAFDKYVEWYTKSAEFKGVDPYIGKKLVSYIIDSGFKDIDLNVINPAFNSGTGKIISTLTLQNIAQSIISANIAAEVEVRNAMEELEKFTFEENTIVSIVRIMQVKGVKELVG